MAEYEDEPILVDSNVKPGTKVICVDAGHRFMIKEGHIYTIKEVVWNGEEITLEETGGASYFPRRFAYL